MSRRFHAIQEDVVSTTPSGAIVLVQTAPGAAALVGAEVDGLGRTEIRGTVAGDDVLLVVCADAASDVATAVAAQLKAIATNSEERPYWPACRALIRDIAPSGQHVVVRTVPGAASVIGAAVDTKSVPGAVATVAGDDVLLVICAEPGTQVASGLADRLRRHIATSEHPLYWPAYRDLIREVVASGQHVLIRTLPGAAPIVGAAVDTEHLAGAVASVAGDDVLLIVCEDAPTRAATNVTNSMLLLRADA